jgi:ATP-dependent helicase/DNAse subunit B
MTKDKYKATWVSHSSISDFLTCPRLYYLRSVYKDPKTGHKITLMTPPLALGQAVHDVIDEISKLPADKRMDVSLGKRLEAAWKNIEGKKGGFKTEREEKDYKQRGLDMLRKLEENPGPLVRKAIKVKQDLPYFWISDEDNIILCGKIDWIEYLDGTNSVHIIDFKTGKNEEPQESLQLPIYYVLATNIQKRKVDRLSYWYLDKDDVPSKQNLPDLEGAKIKVLDVARRVKLARQIDHFKCPKGGCYACRDLERILKGEGERVGVSNYNQDIYVLLD